jgi:hypothetical protein
MGKDNVMSDALTYYSALQVLGKKKSRLVALLDMVTTAGVTVWAAGALATGKAADLPLSIFELKNEIVRYTQEIVRRVSDWHSGLSRFDRSERLAAAHAVLVISSYFEALAETDLPIAVERLAMSGEEQAALAAGGSVPEGYVEMIEFLIREPLPLPEPHRSYDDVRRRLANCYAKLSDRLVKFVSGLGVWEELDDEGRSRLKEAIRRLPAKALDRYDDGYRFLATDIREFGVWAGLTEIHALGAALSGISSLMSEMTIHPPGERPRAHLAMSYRAGT